MGSESTRKVDIGIGTGNSEDGDDEKKSEIKYDENEDDSDYEDLCVICFGKWTKEGVHMATRLPCGHVFGFSCISRWVNVACNCPVCKSICNLRQMIGVYQSLETLYDSSSTSVGELVRLEVRWNARRKRRAARAKMLREARRLLNQRYREAQDANGSQDS